MKRGELNLKFCHYLNAINFWLNEKTAYSDYNSLLSDKYLNKVKQLSSYDLLYPNNEKQLSTFLTTAGVTDLEDIDGEIFRILSFYAKQGTYFFGSIAAWNKKLIKDKPLPNAIRTVTYAQVTTSLWTQSFPQYSTIRGSINRLFSELAFWYADYKIDIEKYYGENLTNDESYDLELASKYYNDYFCTTDLDGFSSSFTVDITFLLENKSGVQAQISYQNLLELAEKVLQINPCKFEEFAKAISCRLYRAEAIPIKQTIDYFLSLANVISKQKIFDIDVSEYALRNDPLGK